MSADVELSTADTVDAELIDEAPDPKRAAWLGGMRELCDWLETHPEVPLPYLDTQAHNQGQGYVPALIAYIMPWESPRETFATVARAMGRARKTVNDATGRFYLSRRFADAVDYVASVPREEVCERVVVGTHEVTEEVPDPEHVAAAPLVTRTRTVEEVTWRCTPVLADALPAGGAS